MYEYWNAVKYHSEANSLKTYKGFFVPLSDGKFICQGFFFILLHNNGQIQQSLLTLKNSEKLSKGINI